MKLDIKYKRGKEINFALWILSTAINWSACIEKATLRNLKEIL